MGNVRDLAAMIEANRAEVAELSGPIDSSKGQAEATVGAVAQLGIEGRAAQLRQAVERIEEAQAIRAAIEGVLVKAHWQAMSAVHGTMGPGAAKGSGPGGSFIAADGTVTTRDGRPAAGPLDAVPPHLRQDPTPTGEELTGVDPTLSPFQKEHENANADQGMSKFRRGARNVVRNIGDLKDASDQLAKPTMKEMSTVWEPPETYPVVGTPEPLSTYTAPPQAHADYQGAVGNLVVVAALIAEVAARRMKHWKGQR